MMEALLPSEVARLVLGYLEEEKCESAAKCFLDTSPELSEYRSLALKGKRYPTKVNGYSLKEVLEEYVLVHTIVQESLSSMSEQPSVGGSMIDSLRFLVRACQPVQVHINLHPQTGQNSSGKIIDSSDSATSSSRPRSRKTTLSSDQTIESLETCSKSKIAVQPGFSENISSQRIDLEIENQTPENPHSIEAMDIPSLQSGATLSDRGPFQLPDQVLSLKCQEKHCTSLNGQPDQQQSHQDNHHSSLDLPHQETFQDVNIGNYHEPTHLPQSSVRNSSLQELHMSSNNSNGAVLPSSSSEFPTQLHRDASLPLNSQTNHSNKAEEPVRSFTVKKYFGSNIVIIGNDEMSQSCLSANIQDKTEPKKIKSATPKTSFIDPEAFSEKVRQKMLEDESRNVIVNKIVEKLEHGRTPGKKNNDGNETLGEDDLYASISDEMSRDPYFKGFFKEIFQGIGVDYDNGSGDMDGVNIKGEKNKKKRLTKKKSSTSSNKTLPGTSTTDISSITPSKLLLENCAGTKSNDFLGIGSTPAKMTVEHDNMTPITKLLSEIPSPSGETFLDPAQFASLIDLPSSTVKFIEKDGLIEGTSKPSPPSEPFIQLPHSDGTTMNIPILICNSDQQVAQYVNEEGVKSICEIQLMSHHGPYKPIIPKIVPGEPLPAALLGNHVKERRKQGPKRCLTRGGRQSAGQMHSVSTDMPVVNSPEKKNTVTMYAANSSDDVSSTITVNHSSDLPILVADTETEVMRPQATGSQKDSLHLKSSPEPTQSTEDKAETGTLEVISEDKILNTSKEEEKELPSVNFGPVRNTPGLSSSVRTNDKRLSLSTPRRRPGHIRALDFNTPPKANESFRKANTSPKNLSMNAISPCTAGKLPASSVRDSFLKPSNNMLQRSSKAKAHLFKSPDYPMSMSSGFKIPSASSTPAVSHSRTIGSPVPTVSSAWDEVGGVSRILDPEISPVKDSRPPCKKEVCKSWDADLRGNLGSYEEPTNTFVDTRRKRKAPQPAPKKVTKRKKKSPGKKDIREEEEILNKSQNSSKVKGEIESQHVDQSLNANQSQNASTESEKDVAKMIEDNLNNLMDCSVDAGCSIAESCVRGSPAKLALPLSSPRPELLDIEDNIKAYTIEKDPSGGKALGNEIASDESSASLMPSKDDSETPEPAFIGNSETGSPPATTPEPAFVGNSETRCPSATKPEPASVGNSETKSPSATTTACFTDQAAARKKSSDSGINKPTTLHDSIIPAVVDKYHHNQGSWKESFSFDTPSKDDIINIIPQTPRVWSPNSRPNEDTPHTKIIKALPFPTVPSAENSVQTPVVPPTPTIRTTPSVSPNGPAYFEPIETPVSPACSKKTKNTTNGKSDELENILIQECSRIEADGMRETVKRPSSKLSCDDQKLVKSPVNEESTTVELKESTATISDANVTQSSNVKPVLTLDINISGSQLAEEGRSENAGCARMKSYQRRTPSTVHAMARDIGNVSVHKKRTISKPSSEDDTDDCVIISPQKSSSEQYDAVQNIVSKTCQVMKGYEIAESDIIAHNPPSLITSTTIVVIKEAPKLCDEKGPSKRSIQKTTRTPQKIPLSPVILAPPEQTETAAGKLDNLFESVRNKSIGKSAFTPTKVKGPPMKKRIPSSKKKSDFTKVPEEMITEDESSESSSDSSSSDSDSYSSSSSSEDGSPVKENVSPAQLNSPLRTRPSDQKQEKVAAVIIEQSVSLEPSQKSEAVSIDKLELETQSNQQNLGKDQEIVSSTSIVPRVGENTAQSQKPARKSLLETKNSDKTGETSVKVRNPFFMSELEEKRLRTLERLNQGASGKRNFRYPKKITGSVESNEETITPMTETTCEIKVIREDGSSHLCKNSVTVKDLPKKRRVNSASDKVCTDVSLNDDHSKRRSVSESASKSSDDDEEFKLHLSGDEKEECALISQLEPHPQSVEIRIAAPPEPHPQDVEMQIAAPPEPHPQDVEMQIAALHGEDCQHTEVKINAKVHNMSKSKERTIEVSSQPSKDTSKGPVSSKAADKVLKSVLEKGLGCSLPVLPTEKIKKLPPNLSKLKTAGNIVSSPLSQVLHEAKDDSVQRAKLSKSSPKNSSENAVNNSHDGEESEVILLNTSLNKLDYKLMYSGLGVLKPKKSSIALTTIRLNTEADSDIVLSPSSFITLYDPSKLGRDFGEASSENVSQTTSNKMSETRESRQSSGSRRRRSSPDYRSRNRNGSVREVSYEEGRRPLHDRSPSPKFRRNRDRSHDQGRSRDSHSKQDRSIRPRSNGDRQVVNSHHRKKVSEIDSRSEESSRSLRKKETEEGEILSSDSDFEERPRYKERETSNSARRQSIRNRKTVPDRQTRGGQQGKRTVTPPREHRDSKRRVLPPRIYLRTSPDKKKNLTRRTSKEEKTQSTRKDGSQLHKKDDVAEDEDFGEEDLDVCMDFPVLGDEAEETDSKETEQKLTNQEEEAAAKRRRAPPRSVNAHKALSSDTKTPVKKGKRKLSTSPGDISEDSCQSSLGSVGNENRQMRFSRRSKLMSSNSAAPATKTSKPDEGDKVADSSEIIEDFDVESILSKIHG